MNSLLSDGILIPISTLYCYLYHTESDTYIYDLCLIECNQSFWLIFQLFQAVDQKLRIRGVESKSEIKLHPISLLWSQLWSRKFILWSYKFCFGKLKQNSTFWPTQTCPSFLSNYIKLKIFTLHRTYSKVPCVCNMCQKCDLCLKEK